ncbi:cation:proton antiporter [Shewanella phaeophyticola]|uniref:Monovalent cation/H(+) antiporter subunit G n=1 Tax=Shewanella phaeophyticola TaxID=2978345 RepID=A0ABT2P2C0_9GAMM|nr:monovalent cation/H(+) antiporter subunit G [Shewanella sp. KJ10-1]MCT8986791.1 monovalent cation/H(+) antiporter subunit G [Shewanella sp. KJ10-1]
MIDFALDILSWILLVLGGACVLIGGIGGLRLPNFYTRIHAASLTDTMATILIFVGMILQAGLSLAAIKLFAIMLFLLLTGLNGYLCVGQCRAIIRSQARRWKC